MSGLMNKVKDALTGEKNTPAAHAANQGASDYDTSSGLTSGTTLTAIASQMLALN